MNRRHFESGGETYARYRPGYPEEVVRSLLDSIPSIVSPVVADIGSGTGIFSRLLLDHGCTVRAVEPNDAMRQAAESRLGENPRFESVEGEAVATGLEDASVDAIAVAQAFHWFASDDAVREFRRILRPGGAVLLVWNDRKTDSDEFHRAYEDLLVRYCTDYVAVTQANITEAVVRGLFGGWHCELRLIENRQDLDWGSLRGRLESSSYCPSPEHPDHPRLMAALRELFDRTRSGSTVAMQYTCRAFLLSPEAT